MCINGTQSSGRIQLSFDTLFPETAAKQLYDTMLQLWSDVTLLHDETVKDKQKQDVADIVTGQLVRIGYLIEHIQTKNNTLNYSDIAYLRSIVGALSDRFNFFVPANFTNEDVESPLNTLYPITHFFTDGARRFFAIKSPHNALGNSNLMVLPFDTEDWNVDSQEQAIVRDQQLSGIQAIYWIHQIGATGSILMGTNKGVYTLD